MGRIVYRHTALLKIIQFVLFLLIALNSKSAFALTCSGGYNPSNGITSEGCNPASRHPFIGFWITSAQGNNSEWFPGGDVAAAFEADAANINTYRHSQTSCVKWYTVYQSSSLGSAPIGQTGGPWRSVYANRTTVLVNGACFGQPPGSSSGVTSLSAICGEGNQTGLVTGVDDACYCPVNKDWSESLQRCASTGDRWHATDSPDACSVNPAKGNPIFPLMGSKRQSEPLGFSIGHEIAVLVFDSLRKVPYIPGSSKLNGLAAFPLNSPAAFQNSWESGLHKALQFMTSSVQAYRGGGHWVSFSKTGTNYVTDAKVIDAVFQISAGWRYIDKLGLAYETYDSAGRIQRVDYANGGSLDYSYSTANTPASQASSPGLLTSITSDKTRSINISYDSSNRVYQITTPQRRFIGFNYTLSNSLHQIQWPDGTMRRFAYERPDLPWALTGVFNETGARHSTFSYDAAGLAIGTALQADPNTRVDEFGVTFSGPVPAWSVTETFDSKTGILWRDHYLNAAPSLTLEGPTGSTSTMTGISVLGSPRLTGQSQPAGSGCTASTSAQSYDANGNIASHNDFNGYRTCYANNLSRNLETSRVEGLASDASCEVTAASAALPAGSRKTSTQWHPDWSLIVKQAEPGRFTTSVYNGQLDPFAGGTTASCAPASATLPDGKPIVVLCRQVEQATTDFDGSQGFSAAVEAGTPAREQRWTYNAVGQVLTAKGPRTDINDTTTYAYYSDTAFTGADPNAVGHTLGDLLQTTNPAGHVTRYTKYNKTGQVLEMIDPNGIVTANAYDARQRLISTSVGGQASTYEYWPTGLLKMATQPDGSYLSYAYDDAHRLIQVGDQLGNSVSYTLDNMGKRTAESVRDPSGILRHALSRSIDALGRVQQLTGRPQ